MKVMEHSLSSMVSISAKCNDMCEFSTRLKYEVGYPPNITGLCGGDYVEFDIDAETGVIHNWAIIKEQLKEQGFI